jgi:8-amino-7-oxononanoate synthase
MDLFEKCFQFTEAKEAMAGGYYPYFLPLEDTEGTEVVIRGQRLIMIGSNNYLGLTTHPKVRQAAIEAIQHYGTSCTGSRFLNGNLALIMELEEKLARFMGKDAALVFSTGFQTNLGSISAIMDQNDIIIADKEVHASIVDGIRMSKVLKKTHLRLFKHNDTDDLEAILKACPDNVGRLVIVDGVFSMAGDIAPLDRIAPLAKKYGARLMVDDAHAIGVLGGGRGTAHHFGHPEWPDLVMGTFSKSFASLGGVIAGPKEAIHWIQLFARPFMFSASLPPANVAAVLACLDVLEKEPERVTRVNQIGERVRRELKGIGYDVGPSQTPIIPIVIGDEMKTIMAWKTLYEAGIYTNVALPPAVPPNYSLLRTSYMASHTDEQVDRILETFKQVKSLID